jgi:alkylation response protein AidB-like acyl-CoA dehydrogenase
MELSTAAFLGFRYSPTVAMVLDRALEKAQLLAQSLALDIMGAPGQIRVDQEEGPLSGRFEGTYRATVVETIGGGSSEIQKNIIARRKLGLPKNF